MGVGGGTGVCVSPGGGVSGAVCVVSELSGAGPELPGGDATIVGAGGITIGDCICAAAGMASAAANNTPNGKTTRPT